MDKGEDEIRLEKELEGLAAKSAELTDKKAVLDEDERKWKRLLATSVDATNKERARKGLEEVREKRQVLDDELDGTRILEDEARGKLADFAREREERRRVKELRIQQKVNLRMDANKALLMEKTKLDFQEAHEYWLRFEEKLGEIMVNVSRTGDRAGIPENFMPLITRYPEQHGYVKCLVPGYMGEWMPHAIVRARDGSKARIAPTDEARRRDDEDRAAFDAELRKK